MTPPRTILVPTDFSATADRALAYAEMLAKTLSASLHVLVSGVGMLVGFACFLAFLVIPFLWAWLLVFVGVFCLFFNTGPTNTILANVIHPSLRATAFALNIFIIHALGDAISPPIIGAIADRSNLTVGFVIVSGMILVSGLLWLWGAPHLARDTALALTRLDAPAVVHERSNLV